MRLTLRTLLAYLDDILEPADADDIGRKIDESEFATGIVNRIHDCMRRLRLGVPSLHGRGLGGDANTVAEYLDNTMAPDLVPEFEKVCLESDVHLAEVAASHQILTLVLGEPAEVDPASRQRMYGLINEPGPARTKKAAAVAPPVVVRERRRPVVPDYLRENEPASSHWFGLAVAGLIVLALLGAGVAASVWFRGAQVAQAPEEEPTGKAQVAENADAQVDASAEPTTADAARTTAADATDAETNVGASRETAADRDTPVETAPAGNAPTTEVAAPERATGEPGEKMEEPPVAPAGEEATTTKVEPTEAATETTTADADAAAGDATPAEGPVGRFVSENQVLVRQVSPNDWARVPTRDPLANNEVLINLPNYRSTLSFGSGVTVQLLGPVKLEVDKPDASGVPGLRIAFGRLVLMNSGTAAAKIRLAIGDQFGQLVLSDASAVAGLEVVPMFPAGSDPSVEPGQTQTILYAGVGTMAWRAPGSTTDEAITSPAIRVWQGDAPGEEVTGQELPLWLSGEQTLSEYDSRAAKFVDETMTTDRSARLTLTELAAHRRPEVKSLAVRSLGLLDSYEPLLEALNDPVQRQSWPQHIDALRGGLARGEASAKLVQKACEKRHAERGGEIYRMLCGYTIEQLRQGAAEQLVGYLDDSDTEARVLANWNLEQISGRSSRYRATDAPAVRQPQVRQWKLWLQKFEAGGPARTGAAPDLLRR